MTAPRAHGTSKTTSGICEVPPGDGVPRGVAGGAAQLAPAGSSPENPPDSMPFIACGDALEAASAAAIASAVRGGLASSDALCIAAEFHRAISSLQKWSATWVLSLARHQAA